MSYKEDYIPYKDVEEAVKCFSDKVRNNFNFLNLQHQTGIHEVDIKRFETRICITMGCGISAIVMIGVTLEEFLKCLLKYKFFIEENRDENIEPSLDEVGKSSLDAESSFGFFNFHNAIDKCRKEKLITEEEKDQLMHIKKYIRNAFIHSDKSKIFDSNTKGNVDLIKFENDHLSKQESKEMNALELIFAQGLMQKNVANREAKTFFEEIDSLIIQISNRFWESRDKNG